MESVKENQIGYKKTFKKNKWFFSFGAVGHDMVYSLVVSYLLTYIQFGFRLSVQQYFIISLFIGVLGRIWDAITDPIMGLIIQKCHFKLGKYRPWIFIGAVLTGMLTVFLFNTRLEGWSFVVYIIVMNLLWETAYTINDISYWALLPSLSSETKDRNLVSTLTLFFAGVGGGLIQGLITIFQTGNILESYSILSVVSAVAIIFTQGLTAFLVKEKPTVDISKTPVNFKSMIKTIFSNKQLLYSALAMGLYVIGNGLFVSLLYNIYYIEIGYNGDIVIVLVGFAIFSTLCQFIFPSLSKVMTRNKILTLAVICSVTGYSLFLLLGWTSFLPFNLITISISGLFIYSGNSLIYLISVIQITNCVEYNEYITGERDEAIISTVRPFVAKFSTAIKYGLTSLILIISGVFTLSQNISMIEVQKSYFNKISDYKSMSKFEIQQYYLSKIKEYSIELSSIDDEEMLEHRIKEIDTLLAEDDILSNYKLEASYLITCSEMYVIENNKNIGRIKDLDIEKLDPAKNYSLSIIGSYVNENGDKIRYNVGNVCFKDVSTLKERIGLRVLSTVLPIICLIGNWIVQVKFYIIDEKYYDKIVKELEKRNDLDSVNENDERN